MSANELLRIAVETATSRLRALSEADSMKPRRAGAWSPKQILGHLIDSACNNHARFVRAQLQDDLLFTGYDQEAWVAAQRYDEASWPELVELWRGYNLHLARIVAAIPAEILTRSRARHNLHQLAWRAVPETQPVTLEYFVRDYVGHLENHLTQILPNYQPVSFSGIADSPPR